MRQLKISLIFLFIIGTKFFCAAQDMAMYKTLHKLISVKEDLYFTDKYYEKGFLFTLNMMVNSEGIIDSVEFSNFRNDELSKLLDFKKIKTSLLNNKVDFINHKNEVLVLFVMIMRGDDAMTTLENGNQIRADWLNIINTAKSFSNRKQTILIPMLISSVGRRKEF